MASQIRQDRLTGVTRLKDERKKLADANRPTLRVNEPLPLYVDSSIGPYCILRRLSEGGMGVVYLAKRNDAAYDKQVAIKLIKGGMDTDFVLRRFTDERQILASFDHPNIAYLLDGGKTRDGHPYFVMEYVEGKSILQYADDRRLTTTERLNLFKVVCSAVHYAHEKQVVHRDLKPANILVTPDGMPKLLDFGIAKILNPEIVGRKLETTEVGIRLMTPEYASPEQFKGEKITTASDVYSLGVVLFELLTGHQPYSIHGSSREEIGRLVCEEEPQKPSSCVNQPGLCSSSEGGPPRVLTPESVSCTREGTPAKLRRRLAGDLDNIVLMAMRKEPERRYASVDQLSNDIGRHLEGRTVLARKNTFTYKGARFIKRHRWGVLAAALFLILSVVSTTAILRERARAELRSRELHELINTLTLLHESIKDLPGSTPARERLAKEAVEKLDGLANEGRGDKQLQQKLANAYQLVGDVLGNPFENNIGDRQGALASYEKALTIRQGLIKQNPSSVEDQRGLVIAQIRLGQLHFGMGRTKEAAEELQTAISTLQTLFQKNQLDLPTSRALPNAYRTLAYALVRLGDPRAALDNVQKGEVLFESLVATHPEDPSVKLDLLAIQSSLADVRVDLGDYRRALETFYGQLPVHKKVVTDNPNNLPDKINLATEYLKIGNTELLAGNLKAADESFRNMLAIMESAVAADPANVRAQNLVAIAQARLGRVLLKRNRFAEALRNLQLATRFFRRIAENNRTILYSQIQMAYTDIQMSVALAHLGNGPEALEIADSARTVANRLIAADPESVELRGIQAGIYSMLGDVHAALVSYKKTAGEQVIGWKDARHWYLQSYALLNQLKAEGKSTDIEYGTPDELMAKITRCDASLTKLRSK